MIHEISLYKKFPIIAVSNTKQTKNFQTFVKKKKKSQLHFLSYNKKFWVKILTMLVWLYPMHEQQIRDKKKKNYIIDALHEAKSAMLISLLKTSKRKLFKI